MVDFMGWRNGFRKWRDRWRVRDRRRQRRIKSDVRQLTCALGSVADLSLAGMRVSATEKPPTALGKKLEFAIHAGRHRLIIHGRIIWRRRFGPDRYDFGVQFVDLDSAVALQLVTLACYDQLPGEESPKAADSRGGGLPDFYLVLGVARRATSNEIRTAYHALARRFHPDVNQEEGAESRFMLITEAYKVLRHGERRASYDELLGPVVAESTFDVDAMVGQEKGPATPFATPPRSFRWVPAANPVVHVVEIVPAIPSVAAIAPHPVVETRACMARSGVGPAPCLWRPAPVAGITADRAPVAFPRGGAAGADVRPVSSAMVRNVRETASPSGVAWVVASPTWSARVFSWAESSRTACVSRRTEAPARVVWPPVAPEVVASVDGEMAARHIDKIYWAPVADSGVAVEMRFDDMSWQTAYGMLDDFELSLGRDALHGDVETFVTIGEDGGGTVPDITYSVAMSSGGTVPALFPEHAAKNVVPISQVEQDQALAGVNKVVDARLRAVQPHYDPTALASFYEAMRRQASSARARVSVDGIDNDDVKEPAESAAAFGQVTEVSSPFGRQEDPLGPEDALLAATSAEASSPTEPVPAGTASATLGAAAPGGIETSKPASPSAVAEPSPRNEPMAWHASVGFARPVVDSAAVSKDWAGPISLEHPAPMETGPELPRRFALYPQTPRFQASDSTAVCQACPVQKPPKDPIPLVEPRAQPPATVVDWSPWQKRLATASSQVTAHVGGTQRPATDPVTRRIAVDPVMENMAMIFGESGSGVPSAAASEAGNRKQRRPARRRRGLLGSLRWTKG